MDSQGMEGGVSDPGIKDEVEQIDFFQFFIYLQAYQSLKMAPIQALRPENASFSPLFPSHSRFKSSCRGY